MRTPFPFLLRAPIEPVFTGRFICFILCLVFFHAPAGAQEYELHNNAFGQKTFTIESRHFTIHYTQGLEGVAREAGAQFEHLYTIFSKTYNLVPPSKTTILVLDGELTNGFAAWNYNFITIWCHDLDWNLRGTHDWLKGVCTHEYAHIISITSSLKFPPALPYFQVGFFSHPNVRQRLEALHVIPGEILPMWFAEGIAQYEDSRFGSDSWDSHRDMILRTLTLSDSLLSIQHMSVFAGREDDAEKAYDHGFSLVKYISETYGYDKVAAILHACRKLYRFNFDNAIKVVLGISKDRLYAEWKQSLRKRYDDQVKKLGKPAEGRKINKDGFDNYWPKFSPNDRKIFFLSNGKQDYAFSFKSLYSYNLIDTVKEDDRIKEEKGVGGFYSINRKSGLIAYTSRKSEKSVMPGEKGGDKAFDVFIDTLPPEKRKFRLFRHKTWRQVTERKRIFTAAFSPTGDRLACAMRSLDRFTLCIADTGGETITKVYPSSDTASPIRYLYSMDWSSDSRHIAISYIDSGFRKIGIYDTATHRLAVMKNNGHDDRDPRYSADGKWLYFSSDRTGIFNIYRCKVDSGTLQRISNVVGGAFCPDVSSDNKKLVYAGYDKSGFGIFLLDSTSVFEESTSDSGFMPRPEAAKVNAYGYTSEIQPYSHLPRQFLFIPTIIAEQTLPKMDNVFKGNNTFKTGLIVTVMDPLAILGSGTELGAYLMFEPLKIFNLIDFSTEFFGKEINYDLGAFGTTKLLPITLNTEYLQRGIAASDSFNSYNSSNPHGDSMVAYKYAVTLRDFSLWGSHPIIDGINLHLVGSYNWYDGFILPDLSQGETIGFSYNLAKGYRLGAFVSILAPEIDSRMSISPRGMYIKAMYNYWRQFLMNEENGIIFVNNIPQTNYDTYRYHDFGLRLKFGTSSPWYEKHDLYAEVNASALLPHQQLLNRLYGTESAVVNVPSYYKPVEWLPGYTYYYETKGLKRIPTTDTVEPVKYDTVLVTGNAVAAISLSYRFPLWPKPVMDKKLWFIYFDKLYGAVNFSSGAGWDKPSDIIKFRKENWLSSAGLELRLEAQSFEIPLAIKVRWDRGLNRVAPLGGDRFTFGIGFSFDNWEYIDQPDYARPVLH
jgi:Tol biopolymer transport system component